MVGLVLEVAPPSVKEGGLGCLSLLSLGDTDRLLQGTRTSAETDDWRGITLLAQPLLQRMLLFLEVVAEQSVANDSTRGGEMVPLWEAVAEQSVAKDSIRGGETPLRSLAVVLPDDRAFRHALAVELVAWLQASEEVGVAVELLDAGNHGTDATWPANKGAATLESPAADGVEKICPTGCRAMCCGTHLLDGGVSDRLVAIAFPSGWQGLEPKEA